MPTDLYKQQREITPLQLRRQLVQTAINLLFPLFTPKALRLYSAVCERDGIILTVTIAPLFLFK